MHNCIILERLCGVYIFTMGNYNEMKKFINKILRPTELMKPKINLTLCKSFVGDRMYVISFRAVQKKKNTLPPERAIMDTCSHF